MANKKKVRTRGKISLSKYFQEFKEGDRVGVTMEKAVPTNLMKRYQGRTGVIAGKRGRSYIVNMNDQKKAKVFIIAPIHLKKIK